MFFFLKKGTKPQWEKRWVSGGLEFTSRWNSPWAEECVPEDTSPEGGSWGGKSWMEWVSPWLEANGFIVPPFNKGLKFLGGWDGIGEGSLKVPVKFQKKTWNGSGSTLGWAWGCGSVSIYTFVDRMLMGFEKDHIYILYRMWYCTSHHAHWWN